MSDKIDDKKENSNIGKNTQWDSPKVNPNAGSTVRKPSTLLNPDYKPKKK